MYHNSLFFNVSLALHILFITQVLGLGISSYQIDSDIR